MVIRNMNYLSGLKNRDLSKEICLLRVDFNVESAKDAFRLQAVLPTIKFLLKRGAKVVLLSHRGRPKPSKKLKVKSSKEFTLHFVAKFLSKKLNQRINFINHFDFKKMKNAVEVAPPRSIFLLENLRFLPGEEKNDARSAKKLASLGTFYVNDAFAVSHRENASVVAITKFLPSYAGLLLEKEIKNLSKAMKKPRQPLVLILGGAKISDKIGLIKKFLDKAKYILIGGGLANTMLMAKGVDVGESLYEPGMIGFAKGLLEYKNIILPIDWITDKNKILDIGPLTLERFKEIIKKAGTIIWNGPMGYFEDKRFAKGSIIIAKAIVRGEAFSVIGGGETTAIITNYQFPISKNIFLSTGGGAMLEYLAGKKLPGIEALK